MIVGVCGFVCLLFGSLYLCVSECVLYFCLVCLSLDSLRVFVCRCVCIYGSIGI